MSGGNYNLTKADIDTTLDLKKLKPYGDTMNDGKVQLSFTLPVADDEKGEEAARQMAKKMGFEEPGIAYHRALDSGFTFYVVYGSTIHTVDWGFTFWGLFRRRAKPAFCCRWPTT